ncbi:putative transposase/invertase (TIGR01784 family) [Salibacterium salarium]|uniref:transposase n=1 Tax=Salibacterium salarium TaxID=284579 RepID=UPI002787B577|nr:transposase [Salibacterium salarium]MDQ0300556.1 putative transposase/invertase (TIGR01784 family) [Salibacterium salarium]
MMIRINIDPAPFTLLTGFFETYLTLTPSEEEQLREEVKTMEKQESDKVMELMVSYEKKGMEKTKEEIASEMLKKDMDVETIAEVTELTTKEVLQLKQQ